MGDTGLDYDHCMFRDDARPVSFSTDTSGVRVYASTSHRKLRYYRAYVDAVDVNGHGTHCAGSAVGALQASGEEHRVLLVLC